jgi:hypothetical protein
MDRDVAEWLPQWFDPIDQVEVIGIDSSGVIRPQSGRREALWFYSRRL